MAEVPDLLARPSLDTSQAPTPGVSPGQVAAPYEELSRALGKTGEALETTATTAAERAGLQAVTTDEHGNVQIQKYPIIGQAATAYERAMKIAALAQGEGAAKDTDIQLRGQYQDNPDGYLQAANQYKDKVMKQYADLGVPEVGISLGRAIDTTTTFNYRQLAAQKRELDLRSAGQTIDAGIAEAQNTLIGLARRGDLSAPVGGPSAGFASPEFVQAFEKLRTLTNEKVSNPLFAYPQEKADYDIAHFDSELRGASTLFHVDSVYHDTSFNPADNSPNGGYQKALTAAQTLLTDPSLNLTEEQRQHFYNVAVGELHANEALRHQDLQEARLAEQSFIEASMFGGLKGMSSAEINQLGNQVATAFNLAGDPAGAARVYGRLARMPLGDDWTRTRTIAQQTQDVNELQGAPRQRAAYNFFLAKGYSPEQAAGIVGGLRGETENLNPSQIHDQGRGFGIAGWNAERLQGLRQFAATNNADPRDLNTQLEYVHYELTHGESAAGERLRAATTPEQAGNAMLNYFRPANYNVPGAHPERAAYARVAFNAFGPGGPPTTGAPDGGSPAKDLWLAANRSTELSKETQAEWKQIMTDYAKNGVRPANTKISEIVDAAHAADDHGLLEQIAADTDRMDASEAFAGKSLPEQSAILGTLEQKAQAGELQPGTPVGLVGRRGVAITAGDGAVLKDLEQRHAALIKGLDENAISTGAALSGGRFSVPQPLDFSDMGKLAAGLQQRVPIARFANQTWQGKPVAALDDADVKQIQGRLENPDPAARQQIWGALSTLPDDVRNPTLQKIAGADQNRLAEASAGSMLAERGDGPAVGKTIIQGLDILRRNDNGILKAFEPKAGGEGFDKDVTAALPPSAFGIEGRESPTGNYATTIQMVKARYAYLAVQANKSDYNANLMRQAVNDVTGGTVTRHGGVTLAPERGMNQYQFDSRMAGLTDQDFAGVTSQNGQPISADYVRANARLETIGPGQYLLNFSGGADPPIYAHTGWDTARPFPFVLDMTGRKPAEPNYTLPAEIPSYGTATTPAPRRPFRQPTLSGEQPTAADLAFSSGLGIRG